MSEKKNTQMLLLLNFKRKITHLYNLVIKLFTGIIFNILVFWGDDIKVRKEENTLKADNTH